MENDVKYIFTKVHPPEKIFSSVKSKKLLDQVLVQEFNMVKSERHVIGTGLVWKKRKVKSRIIPKIIRITFEAHIVPFSKNLINLLGNKQVMENILNLRPAENGVYWTVLDGTYYKQHPVYKNDKNALGIIFYSDDLGLANVIGSAAKAQKTTNFYWTLGNIHPEFRSSKNSVQLYAMVKTAYLKKPGALEKVLEPFINDIKMLQTEGVNIQVNGQTRNFKGFLLFCPGDTPAQAILGGFKESVAAYRPCRSCMITCDQLKSFDHEDQVHLRNQMEHDDHVAAISDKSATKTTTNYWKKNYGINCLSPLSTILDVTKCLPHAVMHVLVEGTLLINCVLLLNYCIMEQLFTIDEFNNKLINFDYGHFNGDKPAVIEIDHLQKGTLRQSAPQLVTLSNCLPFLIAASMNTEDYSEDLVEKIDCFNRLLQILQVCCSYEIQEKKVTYLGYMIKVYLRIFNKLYPEHGVPKFHFMVHFPD